MTEAPGTHNPQFLPPNIRCLSRCRRPKLHRSICRSSVAGLLFMSIRVRACPVSIRLMVGTRSLAREAARRSRAHSTIISASSRAWASRSSMVCRHRTPPIRRRRRRGCTCRLRFLSDEKLTLTRALNLPTFSTELKRMALVIDDNTITKVFYPVFPPDKNAAEVIAWLQRSR
jgi:hypothetical protein